MRNDAIKESQCNLMTMGQQTVQSTQYNAKKKGVDTAIGGQDIPLGLWAGRKFTMGNAIREGGWRAGGGTQNERGEKQS